MLSFDHIFNVKDKTKAAVSPSPALSVMTEASVVTPKPLPINVQKTIAQIAWKTNGRALTHQNYNEDFEFCEDEIKKVMSKKSWNAMDKCFKWIFIDSYLATFNLPEQDVANIKISFTQNKLKKIEFSNKERRIVTLNLVLREMSL